MENRSGSKIACCASLNALAVIGLLSLNACGGGGGVEGNGSSPPVVPSSASFTVETAWMANPDDPDGYMVYVGATQNTANTLVRTLSKGAGGWNPASPSTQLTSNDVVAAIGTGTQVCVAVRAFNSGGVSVPSNSTCAALP